MSNLSIVNNDMDVNVLNSLYPKYPGQISLITVITVPQVLPNDASYVFCSAASAGVINLVLPSAAPSGKNLFIVNRTSTATGINSQSAAGTNLAVVIDIEVDPNVLPAVPQYGILPGSSWVHLVSNGTYWVAVSKSNLAPAV